MKQVRKSSWVQEDNEERVEGDLEWMGRVDGEVDEQTTLTPSVDVDVKDVLRLLYYFPRLWTKYHLRPDTPTLEGSDSRTRVSAEDLSAD